MGSHAKKKKSIDINIILFIKYFLILSILGEVGLYRKWIFPLSFLIKKTRIEKISILKKCHIFLCKNVSWKHKYSFFLKTKFYSFHF